MTDREDRQHVIKVLQKMVDWMEAANYIVATPERRHALLYAIASIETDLKYDLLYEKTSGQADKPTTKNDVSDINVGNIEPTTKENLAVDAISRTEAQTKIEMNASRYTISKERGGMGQVEWSDQLIKVSDAVNIIRELPPATPQPRKGHWVLTDVEGDRVWHCHCSECGKDPQDYVGGSENWWLIKSKLPKFCPNCGSRNEVEE